MDVHVSLLLKLRLRTCFIALVRYTKTVIKIVLKLVLASVSVNIGKYSPRPRLGEYSPMLTPPSANNC